MTKITKNATERKPSFDEHLMNKQVSVRGLLTHLRDELFAADRLLDEVRTDDPASGDACNYASYRIRTAYRLIESAFDIEPLTPPERTKENVQ